MPKIDNTTAPYLPPPVVAKVGNLWVVRDDLLPGGTKRRALPGLLVGGTEFVYASPAYGYAQVALAYACRDAGYKATVLTARRKIPHPRTQEAIAAGAQVIMVPNGYLSVAQCRARVYASERGAVLLPFGFDVPVFRDTLTQVARGIGITPKEVWVAAGSGMLCRALQKAWPGATTHAIQIGKSPQIGEAILHVAPERFEQDAIKPPPYPSCSNYDAKVWRFVEHQAIPGALVWNVAR